MLVQGWCIHTQRHYSRGKKTFKEDPATVQVNYISLEQYKHKGKCMQKGEENIPGGRRRSCNAIEGYWRDYQCCRLFQLFLPYSLFVSWVLTSAIFVPLSLLVICTFWRQTKELQRCWRQLARLSVLSSVPTLSPLFSIRLLSFNFCNLRPSLSIGYLHFLLPYSADFILQKREQPGKQSLLLFLFFFSFFRLGFLSFLCSFLALFSCSFFAAPIRSLEGLIYILNMSLFRKDSMH